MPVLPIAVASFDLEGDIASRASFWVPNRRGNYGTEILGRGDSISILVAQGKTWDQIAAFVGHLDQKTTQRYIHSVPKDKRETANSIPFGL